MSYSTLASALSGYLTTAGNAMTGPQLQGGVRPGEPDNVNLPTIAFWFLGTKTWEANTLSKTQELWGWHIRIYAPVGPRYTPIDGGVEAWISQLTQNIRAQLYGNVSAGGAATGVGMELTDATTGYAQMGAQLNRVVDMEWWAMLSNVSAIAA